MTVVSDSDPDSPDDAEDVGEDPNAGGDKRRRRGRRARRRAARAWAAGNRSGGGPETGNDAVSDPGAEVDERAGDGAEPDDPTAEAPDDHPRAEPPPTDEAPDHDADHDAQTEDGAAAEDETQPPPTDEAPDHDAQTEDGAESEEDAGPEPEAGTDPADDSATENEADSTVETGDEAGTHAPTGAEEPPIEAPAPPLHPEPPAWTGDQLRSVAIRALAVSAALGLIGLAVGSFRGGTSVARAEFVYTLDESVPDGFLREDRRLLTQVVTFESDAVLTPVAERFDLTVDQLRGKIDVETLELSEVLRLDVSDGDTGRAVAINRAVLDQYLQVMAEASPVGNSHELALRRVDVADELAAVDAERLALARAAEGDATLEVTQESIQRQIDLKKDRINGLQGLLDDGLVQTLARDRRETVAAELEASRTELSALEAELSAVVDQRAELATATTAEPALLREIARLEAKLATIDDELAERELGPLVASPIRELSEPIVIERTATGAALQGLAASLLISVPFAAWMAHRARRRQLWSA
jgi:hypothetical protein